MCVVEWMGENPSLKNSKEEIINMSGKGEAGRYHSQGVNLEIGDASEMVEWSH